MKIPNELKQRALTLIDGGTKVADAIAQAASEHGFAAPESWAKYPHNVIASWRSAPKVSTKVVDLGEGKIEYAGHTYQMISVEAAVDAAVEEQAEEQAEKPKAVSKKKDRGALTAI